MAHKSRYQLADEVKTLTARDGISMTEAKRRVEVEYLIEQIKEMPDDARVQAILLGIMRLI